MITRLAWAAALLMASLAARPAAQAGETFSASGLHYRLEGRGPDVVLIHAFQMDLREWDGVVPTLTGSRRVLRYDVRGHGTSKVDGDLPSTVVDLLGLLDELKIQRPTLVGLSMGATIALDFTVTHPDRVDRLVLVSPGPPGVPGGKSPEWLKPVFDAVRAGDARKATELWWQSPLFDRARANEKASGNYKQIVTDNYRIWTFARRPPALEPPAGTRLKEIRVPMLTVAGDADPLGGQEIARAIAAGVPDGRVVVLPDAGHMLSFERPADVARLILEK